MRANSGVSVMELLLSLIVICIGLSVRPVAAATTTTTEDSLRIGNASEVHTTMEVQCRQPKVDPESSEIGQLFWAREPLRCPGQEEPNPFRVIGNLIRVRRGYHCSFAEILRAGEGGYVIPSHSVTGYKFILKRSDFALVNCTGPENRHITTVAVGLRRPKHLDIFTGWKLSSKKSCRLNVLVIGFGSVAQPAFMKMLPKTYNYLVNKLDAIVLNGYNIVGESTPDNLSPLLTGFKIEDWFPELNSSTYADPMPHIWKRYKENGYVTVYAEDMPEEGTFNRILKGFRHQPTDHYMRHLYQYLPQSYRRRTTEEAYCFGKTPRHNFMLNYIRMAFKIYSKKPKFVYTFHSEMSRMSVTALGMVDLDLKLTLQRLDVKGYLNSTFLLVMSDQGPRLRNIVQSELDKQLYQTPMMALVPPPWFKIMYPRHYTNLLNNSHRLTTPYDVHSTLLNLLDVTMLREGSLFTKIPTTRTCREAGIQDSLCGCLNWKKMNNTNPFADMMAQRVINKLNNMISSKTPHCRTIRLLNVTKADWAPNNGEPLQNYKLQVVTSPGLAVFAFTLVYDRRTGQMSFPLETVSRLNHYEHQAYCLSNLTTTRVDLRPFCFCKTPLEVFIQNPQVTSTSTQESSEQHLQSTTQNTHVDNEVTDDLTTVEVVMTDDEKILL